MNSLEALSVFPQLAKLLPLDEYEHACSVAGKCKDDERTCMVALIHDIVEDNLATFEEMRKRFNLDSEQMVALDAITRRDGERYFAYIKRCKQNEIAKTVKLADLEDNINRCAKDLPNRWSMLCRYSKAYGILVGKWRESKR